MTISDEPDEDADNLDDDALLEGMLRPALAASAANADAGTDVPDWPACGLTSRSLGLDPSTVEWFKDNHVDWFAQIRAVLHAWVEVHQRNAPPRD